MNNFSPNMLKTFKQCSKKYYFKYIRQISAPQKTSAFEKGKKIHALASYYLRGDDISKLEKVLNQEEAEVWEKLKANEYFQKTYVNSEYNLSCRLENFWIGGRLDALVREENNFYILDYKTGSIPQNPQYDFQTMVYLLAVDKFLEEYETLSFIYIDLKNNSNFKIDLNDDLKNQYEKEILKICSEITKTSEFPQNTNACKYCEFSKLC